MPKYSRNIKCRTKEDELLPVQSTPTRISII
jgi:hypothetical protein